MSGARTELFGQWLNGALVIADQGKSTGRRVFVHSGTGVDAAGYGGNPDRPVATLDYAIGLCTDNEGDVIYVMPGHAETYSTTGVKVTVDVDGIRIVGLGQGADRPTFTFSHMDATWTVSANGVRIENLLFAAGVDSVVTYATISGADCAVVGCELRDATDVEVITDLTVTGDRFTMLRCFKNGYTGGNANVRVVSLNGVDGALVEGCLFVTKVTTAVIGMVTADCSGIVVRDSVFLVDSTTDLSKNVVDGMTSVWSVDRAFDIGAGGGFSGGSGSAVATDSVSALATILGTPAGADLAADIAAIGVLIGTPAVDVVTDLTALIGAPAVDLATDIAALGTLIGTPAVDLVTDLAALIGTPAVDLATDIAALGTLIGTPAVDLLTDLAALIGTPAVDLATDIAALGTLIGTPAVDLITDLAALIGTPVADLAMDIAAVLAEAQGAGLSANAANYLAVAADLTNATWNSDATHEVFTVTGLVRMRMLIEVTGNVESGGDTATLTFGHEGNAAAWIAATNEDALDTGDLWYDTSPTTKEEDFATAVFDKVVRDLDVGYEIDVEACTGGSIVFHVWWEPLNATGAVVAGDGSALA